MLNRFRKETKEIKVQASAFSLIKKIIIGLAIITTTIALIMWFFYNEPLYSPLSNITSFQFLNRLLTGQTQNPKIVYGFLPYWNLNQFTMQPELTHLAYFSLGIDANGNIMTKNNSNEQEPGFNKFSSERLLDIIRLMKKQRGKIELVLTQFSNDDIVAFLSNPEAQNNFLSSLDSILLAYPIQGINIDIEYSGENPKGLQTNLVEMLKKLRIHLQKKYKNINLSIDVYALAATEDNIWDVKEIAKQVDYIIIMAYDFFRRSSTQAGPIAPLFGGNKEWEHDINLLLKNFLAKVDRKKLILGIPFYGYGWQTTGLDPMSNTFPGTGMTVTYKKTQELLSEAKKLKLQQKWQATALAPYLTYVEDDKMYVVFYENARSIAYKLEYVKQLDLAGIAIWALGYEGDSRDLWQPIKRLNSD